jgi:hypothetical protein
MPTIANMHERKFLRFEISSLRPQPAVKMLVLQRRIFASAWPFQTLADFFLLLVLRIVNGRVRFTAISMICQTQETDLMAGAIASRLIRHYGAARATSCKRS